MVSEIAFAIQLAVLQSQHERSESCNSRISTPQSSTYAGEGFESNNKAMIDLEVRTVDNWNEASSEPIEPFLGDIGVEAIDKRSDGGGNNESLRDGPPPKRHPDYESRCVHCG